MSGAGYDAPSGLFEMIRPLGSKGKFRTHRSVDIRSGQTLEGGQLPLCCDEVRDVELCLDSLGRGIEVGRGAERDLASVEDHARLYLCGDLWKFARILGNQMQLNCAFCQPELVALLRSQWDLG
ncbi:MAG: hypothetical protein BWX86_01599 [Verrucomicrobia bacterium ADurb.Bin122]|nr:MAG: hypothetical protein BWX86_01599 [Verrucomicrobia bacterium ADurb.Bin122]